MGSQESSHERSKLEPIEYCGVVDGDQHVYALNVSNNIYASWPSEERTHRVEFVAAGPLADRLHLEDGLDELQDDRDVLLVAHGTPGSGLYAYPTAETLFEHNVTGLFPTRGGYRSSESVEGVHRIVSSSNDMIAVANRLGVQKFGAMGGSGGGPVIGALASRHYRRLRKAAIFDSPAPVSIITEARQSGQIHVPDNSGETNQAEFAALQDIGSFTEEHGRIIGALQDNPYALLDHISVDFSDADKAFFADPANCRRVALAHQAAFQNGGSIDGLYQDNIAMQMGDSTFARDYRQRRRLRNVPGEPPSRWDTLFPTEYGFDLHAVGQIGLHNIGFAWGDADTFVSIHETLASISALYYAQGFIEAGAGHFNAKRHMGDILPWMFKEEHRETSFNDFMGRLAVRSSLMNEVCWKNDYTHPSTRSYKVHS